MHPVPRIIKRYEILKIWGKDLEQTPIPERPMMLIYIYEKKKKKKKKKRKKKRKKIKRREVPP